MKSKPRTNSNRVHLADRQKRNRDEERWILNLMAETKAEQARNPMSVEEMLKENDRLARYGTRQAKKLGIKPKDVNRLIHEHRKEARRA